MTQEKRKLPVLFKSKLREEGCALFVWFHHLLVQSY